MLLLKLLRKHSIYNIMRTQLRNDAKNLDEISLLLKEALDKYLAKCDNKVLGLAMSLRRDKVAATHNAPIGERVSWKNYTRYNAWRGRVWFRFESNRFNGFMTNALNGFPFHIGSGGGGDYDSPWKMVYKAYHYRFDRRFSYQTIAGGTIKEPVLYGFTCHIFEDDFPSLAKSMQQKALLNIIADEKVPMTYDYKWTDAYTAMTDNDFCWEQDSQLAVKSSSPLWAQKKIEKIYKNQHFFLDLC